MDYYSQPECPHTWLLLPEPWQADEIIPQLQQYGVLVKSASSFAVGTMEQVNGLRICLTGPQEREQVEKGLMIIRDVIKRHPGVWHAIM